MRFARVHNIIKKRFWVGAKYNSAILFSCLLILSSCVGVWSKHGKTGYYKVGDPYKINGKWYTPKVQPEYDEVGVASWYGSDFHRKETANGGTFDRNALTAAHKTLPLPSMVRVTNLENNKTLIVMVNDRGPFADGRIIDMSERAADILGFKNQGIAKVRVQYLPGQTKRLLADLPGAEKAIASASQNIETQKPEAKAKTHHMDYSANAATPFDLAATGTATAGTSVPIPSPTASASNAKQEKENSTQQIDNIAQEPQYGEESLSSNIADSANKSTENFTSDMENSISKEEEERRIARARALERQKRDTISPEELAATEPSAPTPTPEKIAEISQDVMYIQAGTYGIMGNAKRVEKSLSAIGAVDVSKIKINGKILYRVKVGPILDKKVAMLALKKVITLGHPDAILVKTSLSK